MNVNHQIEIINKYISEGNPLGVPEEIADVEYLIYISDIVKNMDNGKRLHGCIISMLKSLGITRFSEELRQDIQKIEAKINILHASQ